MYVYSSRGSVVTNRQNKLEIKKIRRALEKLEGEPENMVDISWNLNNNDPNFRFILYLEVN